jgi:mRNA interferase RelE/StbE
MKHVFRESFWRDVKKIKDKKTLNRIDEAIAEVDAAENLSEVQNLTKMEGATNAYRIRVGGFRIGFYLEADVVEFVRCLDRKDIYRYFP